MLFTGNTFRKIQFILFLSSAFNLVLILPGDCSNSKNFFPLFPVIQDNVTFWEDIYSKYSINTAVIHDKEDLSLVYKAVPLLDKSLPGAAKVNRIYLKKLKNSLKVMLTKFAAGGMPKTAEEQKIYSLFSKKNTRSAFQKAADNIRIQNGLKERFIDGVVRSGGYLVDMKRIFKSHGLPEDLAYLPHVESSFNLKAYSKFGAAGVWQFTRSTGKQYLTINYIIDERRDPLLSTEAAAKYLKKNFNNLGTWPLAITAYNYGHAGMKRAAAEKGTYENIFQSYRKGRFKFASRNFYAEFLAALSVAKSLEKSHSINLDSPKNIFHFNLPGYLHIQDLSRYFQIDLNTIKEYNPSLRPPVFSGEKYVPKGFRLCLPYSPQLASITAKLPPALLKNSQKRSQYYTVKKGDTAGTIASRHGISLKSLTRANNLNNKSVVYIGQTLKIPPRRVSSLPNSNTTTTASSTSTIVELKNGKKSQPGWNSITTQKLPTNYNLMVKNLRTKDGLQTGTIVVQPEESIGIFAEWLGTQNSSIRSLNNLTSSEDVHPGQKISLPFNAVNPKAFLQKRREFHQETEEDFFSSYKITGFKRYRVAQGDTLWEICEKKFDLPLWLLKKYNNNLTYSKLKHKQLLNIPIVEPL